MTYEPSLSHGVMNNLAKTNKFGSKALRLSTLQKKCRSIWSWIKITVLTSPTCNPNLNIIENVWHLMEEVVYSNKQYNDQKELIHALERCAKFIVENIMNTCKSIPGCLLEVIDVKRLKFNNSLTFLTSIIFHFHSFPVICFNFESFTSFWYS